MHINLVNHMFALVDCNNFYASCERIFNPKLNHQPIVVLSNNDGCIVARSNEAKALGILMAQPLFMVRDIIQAHNVHVFSSNYELYNDINGRLFNILRIYSPGVEVYSVDEAFMDLSGMTHQGKAMDLMLLGHRIRDQIQQWLGLPTSIGIGSTKTLAKVANHFAKKLSYFKGVFDISVSDNVANLYLRHLDIGDLWGIGHQYGKFLRAHDVTHALHFKQLPRPWVRKHLTVMGLRLHDELHGIPCHDLIITPEAKQSLMVSRSFGYPLSDFDAIKQAIAFFATRVATKLRQHGLKARGTGVTLTTKYFGTQAHYSGSQTKNFIIPCQDNATFIKEAHVLLQKIYRTGYQFKKGGVYAYGLVHQNIRQDELFHATDIEAVQKHLKISQAMDHINKRFGSHTISNGMAALDHPWQPQKNLCSPRYTTRWNEILKVS